MEPLNTAVLTPMNTLYTHAYRTPVHTHTHSPGISLMKTGLQMDSHGRREHLELISLRRSDTSLGADFRLTIQTLLMHRNHICLLPILVVNNQQVRWGSVFLLLLTSIAFLLTSLQIQKKGEMPGVEDSPPLFLQQQLKIKRNVSQKSVNSACE